MTYPGGFPKTDVAARGQLTKKKAMELDDEATGDDVAGEEFTMRRSSRIKRKRSDWVATWEMSIRSRASGDSEQVAVSSRGGKPTHMTNRKNKKSAAPRQTLAKYCIKCGLQHVEGAKFCMECGTRRESKPTQPSQPTKSTPRPQSPPKKKTTDTSQVINLVSPAATKRGKGKGGGSRTKKKRFLRCGWQIDVDDSYIAPDGRRFGVRDEAAKYHNCDVAKLEPARKDGWQVYTGEAGTYTEWIAPDQTKLYSYATAVIYARKSAQPLYGKDGITRGLGCFFASAMTKSSTQTVCTPKPIARSSCSDKDGTVDEQSTPQNGANKFVIPTQSAAGADLQTLCSKLANVNLRRSNKAKLEQTLEKYIAPSQLENSMANKVTFANISVSTNTFSWRCAVMQIVKDVTRSMFTYGNVVDTGTLFSKLLAKPETRYLLQTRNPSHRTSKYLTTVDAIINNIKSYLSEMMKSKGPRAKLAQQTYRTVVAACCGVNLKECGVITNTGQVLVSSIFLVYFLLTINNSEMY